MALGGVDKRIPNLVSFGGEQTVGREERKREEEEEEEEEKKRREEEGEEIQRYGTMTINMNICFGLYRTTLDKDFFN